MPDFLFYAGIIIAVVGLILFIVSVMSDYDEGVIAGALAMLVGIVVLVVGAAWSESRTSEVAYQKFMTACMQDHKEYECTASWRAGNHSSSTIIPMPIFIPSR